MPGGHEIATVVPVTFTAAGSQESIAPSHVSIPDISASIGSEENRLLQNEVDALTHDVHALSQRLQATQEGQTCACVSKQLTMLLWVPGLQTKFGTRVVYGMRMMPEHRICNACSAEKARDTTLDDEKYDVRYRDRGHAVGKSMTAHSTLM